MRQNKSFRWGLHEKSVRRDIFVSVVMFTQGEQVTVFHSFHDIQEITRTSYVKLAAKGRW